MAVVQTPFDKRLQTKLQETYYTILKYKYGGLLGPSKVPLFFYFDSSMIDTYKCRSTLITD